MNDNEEIFLIRRYQPQDKQAVKALHLAGLAQFGATEDPYYDSDLDEIDGIYLNNNGDFLVGYRDGIIVAMGAIRKVSDNLGEIKRIRVHRNHQRKGYGLAISLRLIEVATGLGYTELCLDTVFDNIPAIRLFEKLGFTETHRKQIGGYNLIFYAKRLVRNEM